MSQLELGGYHALVCGANRGIGHACAAALAAGARVDGVPPAVGGGRMHSIQRPERRHRCGASKTL